MRSVSNPRTMIKAKWPSVIVIPVNRRSWRSTISLHGWSKKGAKSLSLLFLASVLMHSLIESLLHFFGNLSYIDIFVLMALESSLLPVPSELVMIPAWVSAMNGNIDPFLAVIIWWLGSVLWALLNYWIIGRWLGKPFLEKYGKYILITPEKYRKTEDLFLKNDIIYTFIGRLIPVVRHLISIPAGIFRMKMRPFIMTTFLWATLWCSILVALGYFFWESVETMVIQYGNELKYIAIPALAFFIWYKIFKK